MNNYSTNHPIIPNNSEYIRNRKQVSIHSEDRNIEKFPSASHFEIELPEDIVNIERAQLISWSFPSNYDVFSVANKNLLLTFKLNGVYQPIPDTTPSTPYLEAINLLFVLLSAYPENEHEYEIVIQPGSYNPTQFVLELQNKMNEAVQVYSYQLLVNAGRTDLADAYLNGTPTTFGGYNGFTVAFNEVSNKVWFANNNAAFIITNTSEKINESLQSLYCVFKTLPDYSNWGLPSFIGLTPRNTESRIATRPRDYRFYYLSNRSGDWVNTDPNYPNAPINVVECPNKINLMGPSDIYIDIDGLNHIDETAPFNLSKFTRETNGTNGKPNASFAKIPVIGVPLSMFFDNTVSDMNFKYFDPPAERLRKLSISIRYHNGLLVDFQTFNYTIVIEFTTYDPRIKTNYNMRRI
jgi:hypothetical protein